MRQLRTFYAVLGIAALELVALAIVLFAGVVLYQGMKTTFGIEGGMNVVVIIGFVVPVIILGLAIAGLAFFPGIWLPRKLWRKMAK